MTYTMTATNCAEPRVTFEVTDCLMRIHSYYEQARDAFRDIQIICAETGEVILHEHRSDEWFMPKMTCGECIAQLEWMRHMFDMK